MPDYSNLLTSAAQQGASYLPADAQSLVNQFLPQSPQDALPVSPVVPLAVAPRSTPAVYATPPAKSNKWLYIGGGAAVLVGAFILYRKFKKSGKK